VSENQDRGLDEEVGPVIQVGGALNGSLAAGRQVWLAMPKTARKDVDL